MNREEAKKLLPIIQAYVDGKAIQVRDKDPCSTLTPSNTASSPRQSTVPSRMLKNAGRRCRRINPSDG